ncbi:hypothetical protein ACEXQD_13890 [Herbiconiux sp. P15]|uniref:hypothetical protein n=1 Tax=Herbiconiux liukaitaii TaxID=3342799 RepID=UPI0035BAC93D
MAADEIDYEALAARLVDPEVETGAHRELHGEETAARGRAFLLREYGSEEALRAAVWPGGPKLSIRKP